MCNEQLPANTEDGGQDGPDPDCEAVSVSARMKVCLDVLTHHHGHRTSADRDRVCRCLVPDRLATAVLERLEEDAEEGRALTALAGEPEDERNQPCRPMGQDASEWGYVNKVRLIRNSRARKYLAAAQLMRLG